jgi:hypothetical protein
LPPAKRIGDRRAEKHAHLGMQTTTKVLQQTARETGTHSQKKNIYSDAKN